MGECAWQPATTGDLPEIRLGVLQTLRRRLCRPGSAAKTVRDVTLALFPGCSRSDAELKAFAAVSLPGTSPSEVEIVRRVDDGNTTYYRVVARKTAMSCMISGFGFDTLQQCVSPELEGILHPLRRGGM